MAVCKGPIGLSFKAVRNMEARKQAMQIVFFNPQGNFDPTDRGWMEHPDFGGQLVYVKELALAMAEMGHRVDIVTRLIRDRQWPEFAGDRDAYPEQPDVRILRFPCGPPQFLPKEQLWPHLPEWTQRIVEFYRSHRQIPDVVTAHYADGGIVAVRFREQTGVPFTFTAHSLGAQKMDKFIHSPEEFDRRVEQFQFHRRIAAERVSMAHASRVVVSTQLERQEQYRHRLYRGAIRVDDDRKFAIIPPGVNLGIFGHQQWNSQEETVRQRIRERIQHCLPPDRRTLPLVIASSRLEAKKNHLGLVRAWAVHPQLRQKANLMINVSEHPEPFRDPATAASGESLRILKEICQLLDEANLWNAVFSVQLQSQHELAAAYRLLSQKFRGIFALTTFYEPFGLAPLEAMAAGLPVVVTRNGGPSESLRDEAGNTYGVLVDPHSPEDIARGILTLVEQPARWHQLQQRGLQHIQTRFTWQKTAQEYLQEIERIRQGEDAAERDFPIPQYFRDGQTEDVTPEWLRRLYYSK